MSHQPKMKRTSSARREQIRARLAKLRQSRQRNIIGFPELVGLSVSFMLLLMVVFAYLFYLKPAQSRLEALGTERTYLQNQLRVSQGDADVESDSQTSIAKINASLEDFENNRLAGRNDGRMVLYSELNGLIRRNNLRNTEGPNYASLEALGAATNSSAGRANAKLQSIFPGIGVTLTVEGQYPNLRRFLRDIESSNQFIVINSVEFQRATNTNAVSLRLEMATYFRREEAASVTAPASVQSVAR